MTRPVPDLPVPPPQARITQSRFGWHAIYKSGIFYIERSDFAFTRKGIKKKANRMLRSLNRDELQSKNQIVLEM